MASKTGVGISKILQGIQKYRVTQQRIMLDQFQQVRDNPTPTAVFVTCVDSRVLPTRFTQTCVGDMFIVRNAGNMLPHSSLVSKQATATEPAVLELACVMNNVKHVVVCGHSDCKALNLLYDIYTDVNYTASSIFSPLTSWVSIHGRRTIEEFHQLEKTHFRRPLMLSKLNKSRVSDKFPAYVDVDEKFNMVDKMSMVNTLLQMENVTSYPFMRDLKKGGIHLHAFWFDVYTGEIHCFSRREKTFVVLDEDTINVLEGEFFEKLARDKARAQTNAIQELAKEVGNPIQELAKEVRRSFSTSSCCDKKHA